MTTRILTNDAVYDRSRVAMRLSTTSRNVVDDVARPKSSKSGETGLKSVERPPSRFRNA
jgi:hypothetical protein